MKNRADILFHLASHWHSCWLHVSDLAALHAERERKVSLYTNYTSSMKIQMEATKTGQSKRILASKFVQTNVANAFYKAHIGFSKLCNIYQTAEEYNHIIFPRWNCVTVSCLPPLNGVLQRFKCLWPTSEEILHTVQSIHCCSWMQTTKLFVINKPSNTILISSFIWS